MKNATIKNLTAAGLCAAVGLILPYFFHLFGAGPAFLPMHIPVLICGLLCGYRYGAICGLAVPILSSLLTGMPPLFPAAIAMMFELAAYGLVSGLLYKKYNVYISLIGAMLSGRAVSGIAYAILLGFSGKPYGLPAFLTGAFATALPGIIIQIVIVPVIIIIMKKSGFINKM